MQSVLTSLRPAVVALIASAGISIFLVVAFAGNQYSINSLDWTEVAITVIAFIALRKLKCNPILIISLSGVAGLVLHLLLGI